MTDVEAFNRDQLAYWTGDGGKRWVAQRAHTDVMLAPIAEHTIEAANPRPGERVIDIGCGCGATALTLADRVGSEGRVTGLDLSGRILAVARERAAGRSNVRWQEADAATTTFVPDSDLLFSQLGVMFFGDPVAAFTNLRGALKPDGRLVFACWRDFDENHWAKVPLKAAYEHVPKTPALQPGEPGPFSLADPERVRGILTAAGFANIRLMPLLLDLDIANGGGLERACRQAVEIGAASRALRDYPDAKPAVVSTLRERLLPFMRGNSVILSASVWLVSCERAAS